MIDSQLLTFVGIAFILAITPGADTMLVMRNALSNNKHAGVITTFGICAGLIVHAALSALGLSIILVRSATAFEVIKLIGGGYLIFLGLQSIVKAFKEPKIHIPGDIKHDQGLQKTNFVRHFFMQGLLTNVLNPKVALFYLAFLPQFIQPTDSVLLKSVTLGSIHLFLSCAWLILVANLVSQLRRLLTQPRVKQILEGVTGTILLGLGGRLAFERS